MASFDEKVQNKTEQIEKLSNALKQAKSDLDSINTAFRFGTALKEDVDSITIAVKELEKQLEKAKKDFDELTKVDRGNGKKVVASYENAKLGVDYKRYQNGGILSDVDELAEWQKYFEKMKEGTNDYIKTANKIQQIMDRIDYSSAIKKALPSLEKYKTLQDDFIQKNGSITDKDKLGILQGLLSQVDKKSLDFFSLNTEAAKLKDKISKEIDNNIIDKQSKVNERSISHQYWQGKFEDTINGMTAKNTVLADMAKYYTIQQREAEQAEQEQTRIAKQQADERVRIAQDEHQKKMLFFDKEYIYNGTKYSTGEQLEYFKNYANNIKNSQNYIGMPEVQTQQYEQAMNKVRSLQSQLDSEQKQSIDNIKNRVQEACQFIISIVSKAVDIVKFAISSIGKTFTTIISAFRSIGSIASRIIGLLGNFANRVRECTKTTNLLKGSWTELRSAISLISGAINKLMNNTFINEGKKLLSSIETLNTLIGKDLTQSTIDWANSLENAFGIDAAGIVADMREVAGVLKGLGMTAEDVAVASQNLVSVGQTMSAVIGLDEQTVMNKIYSGMRGMTVAIDDIGLSVRETQMNSFLKEVKAMGGEYANIGTSFANLSEQQRVYVRYAGLMKQFMDVYTPEAYAKALDSITGRLNILSQRFRALKQLIGNFAIQVFNKFVLPLTYAVDMLTAKLKSLFSNILTSIGLNQEDLDLSTGMNHTTVSAEDLADAYDDVTNSAEEAAKASAGLDDWDHVSTLGSSSSSSSSDNFDYTKLMELGDNYAEKLGKLAEEQANLYKEKTKKAWEELKEQIKNDFNTWYKNLTGRDFDAKFNLSVNWTQIKNIAKNITKTFKNIFSTGLGIGTMIVDDLDLGKIITKTLSIVENITAIISKAVEKISPYIVKFYEQYIKPYVETFGEFIDKHLNILIGKVTQWRAFWETGESDKWLSENSDSWFESICNWIDTAIEKVKILGTLLGVLFTGEISADGQELLDNSENARTLNTVKDIFVDINSIITDIKDTSGDIAEDFAEWLQTEGLDDIKELTGRISTLMSEHKEDIKQILEKIAQTKWDIFNTVADKVLDICDWLTEHPDEVCETIETIGDVIQGIVDNIEWLIGAGVAAKIANTFAPIFTYVGIKGALKGVNSVGKEAAEEVAETAGKGATVAGIGVGATGVLTVGGILAVTEAIMGFGETYNYSKLIKEVNELNKTIKENNGVGFSAEDLDNQAAATIKKLKKIYGDDIPKEVYASVIVAYEKMMENTEGLSKEQAQTYAKYFGYQLDQFSDDWNIAIDLEADPSKGRKQIESFIQDIENQVEYGSKVIEIESTYMNDNIDDTNKSVKDLSDTVSTETKSMNTNLSNFGNGILTSEKNISSASISINSALNGIKSTFESVKTLFAEQITAKFNAVFSANTNVNTSNIKWTTGTKTNGLNSFYAHANGGVPKSGSLFMANENGDSELVGNFGGYAGVANQNMIMQAMENAIARGMSKAGVNNNSGNMIFNICQGGMFVGDQSSVRKLANIINSTNSAANKTIANSAFSMN